MSKLARQICETGCDCFATDTMIMMADGNQRYVRDIRPGDRVACADGEAAVIADTIRGQEAMLTRVILETGAELRVTGEHPLLQQDGQWVRADNLHPGDTLQLADGGYGKVITAEIIEYNDIVYNLLTEGGPHKLSANGFVAGDFEMQMRRGE